MWSRQHSIGGPLDPTRPRHVLVINTDQSVLLVVHDVLQEEGYVVSLHAYHDHDLDEIKRLAPDIVVLDYKWSGDDNGWSLLQLLRLDPETVSIPVVLCTGAAREVDAMRNHLAGLRVTSVVKPFLAKTLLTAIANASANGQREPGRSVRGDDSVSGRIACRDKTRQPLQPPHAPGLVHGLRAVGGLQLAEDVAEVLLDGLLRDEEVVPDVPVGETGRNQS